MTLNHLHPLHCQPAFSSGFRVVDYPPANEVALSKLSDEALVSRCQNELPDNVDAYNEIVNRFRPVIFSRCQKMLGSHADAEEACQDVLIRIFRKIHQFEGRSTFNTWLFRVVFNTCMSHKRKLARQRDKKNEFAEQVDVLSSANAADIGIDDLCEAVHKALGKMDHEKRDIVALRFEKGLTLQEIAEAREMKLSATKMRLYRALDQFQKAYVEAVKSAA